jgi:hypothetical protein
MVTQQRGPEDLRRPVVGVELPGLAEVREHDPARVALLGAAAAQPRRVSAGPRCSRAAPRGRACLRSHWSALRSPCTTPCASRCPTASSMRRSSRPNQPHCPRRQPAVFGGYAPRAPVQKPHTKPIHIGKREGRLSAPGRPGPRGRRAPARARALPGPETAEKSGYAPCAPIQKPHTKWIFIGKR